MSRRQKRYIVFKRICDLILAISMIIIFSPLILFFAIWIKLESRGPVIYTQRRPGKNKKMFNIYKLRSMLVEIEKDGRLLTDEERMTVSGRIIRKTSIDELPQLINIIKGEMSFIGPRPFIINYLELYTEEQMIRFDVLPGISSWAAIHGRNNLSTQEKFDYEIHYVKNIGLKIDIIIFFKTVLLVLSCKGIYDESLKNKPIIAGEIINDIEMINTMPMTGITSKSKRDIERV